MDEVEQPGLVDVRKRLAWPVLLRVSAFAVGATGLVSGNRKYRYSVSTTIKNKEKPAAVAKGFAATTVTLARAAPRAGPKVNATLKHAPTNAMVEPRWLSSLMSVAMAVASCTLPSLSPPTTRLSRKVRKSTATHQSATLAIFPHMLQSRAVLRPYLSEAIPIIGLAMACSRENKEPSAPPSNTMSYFSLTGSPNAFLYALRPWRIWFKVDEG